MILVMFVAYSGYFRLRYCRGVSSRRSRDDDTGSAPEWLKDGIVPDRMLAAMTATGTPTRIRERMVTHIFLIRFIHPPKVN